MCEILVLQPKHTACHHRRAYLSKHAYGSVGMVSRLRSWRPRNRGSISSRGKRITFLQSICGCFGKKWLIHLLILWVQAVFSTGSCGRSVKLDAAPSVAEFKRSWIVPPLPFYAFMTCSVTKLHLGWSLTYIHNYMCLAWEIICYLKLGAKCSFSRTPYCVMVVVLPRHKVHTLALLVLTLWRRNDFFF